MKALTNVAIMGNGATKPLLSASEQVGKSVLFSVKKYLINKLNNFFNQKLFLKDILFFEK